MMINKDNFEIYAIDFIDKNLSDADELEFLRFLEKNPDLKFEIKSISNNYLPNDKINFINKISLKHNIEDEQITEKNIDEWCVNALEGNLSEKGKSIFQKTISKNNIFKKTWDEYQKTKFKPKNLSVNSKPYKTPNFNVDPKIEDIDYWCVAELENDLTSNQQKLWSNFKKKTPEVYSIYKKIEQTKLRVENISFPNKQKLKKHKSYHLQILSAVSVAASIFLFYFLININTNISTIQTVAANINNHKVEINSSSLANMPNQIIGIYKLAMYMSSQKKNTIKKPIRHTHSKIDELRPKQLKINDLNLKNLSNELKIREGYITAEELFKIVDYEQQKLHTRHKKANSKNLSLFSVAQASIKLINKTTGTKLDLRKVRSKNKKTKQIIFSTKRFSITKKIK